MFDLLQDCTFWFILLGCLWLQAIVPPRRKRRRHESPVIRGGGKITHWHHCSECQWSLKTCPAWLSTQMLRSIVVHFWNDKCRNDNCSNPSSHRQWISPLYILYHCKWLYTAVVFTLSCSLAGDFMRGKWSVTPSHKEHMKFGYVWVWGQTWEARLSLPMLMRMLSILNCQSMCGSVGANTCGPIPFPPSASHRDYGPFFPVKPPLLLLTACCCLL